MREDRKHSYETPSKYSIKITGLILFRFSFAFTKQTAVDVMFELQGLQNFCFINLAHCNIAEVLYFVNVRCLH